MLILLIILSVLFVIINAFIKSSDNTVKFLIGLGILLLSVHASRKDKHFLKFLVKKAYLIFFCEYLCLMLPVFIAWLIYSNWTGIGFLMLICCLIPLFSLNIRQENTGSILKFLINPFSSNLNFRINIRLPFISPLSFEWISGIRRNFLILIPVYLLFLGLSFKPYVAVAGIIFISILISGFYFYGESREFIELFADNPRQFIWRKIFFNLKLLFITFIPLLIPAIIFQPTTWYFLIGAIIVSSLIQIFAIIFKYSLFQENASLNKNSTFVIINILCLIAPIFWPLPVFMGIRYYLKAQENLKQYFHD